MPHNSTKNINILKLNKNEIQQQEAEFQNTHI